MSDDKKNWWMEIDHLSDFESQEGLRKAKELLLELDDVKIPENDDFFDQLHDKIMAGVETAKIQKDTRTVWQRHSKLMRMLSAAAVAGLVFIAGAQTQSTPKGAIDTDQVLADALSRSQGVQETVLVYQNKDDFFVDLAQESLDHLPVEKLQGLMGIQID